jgi:Tfp pilus assembly protein PilV
MKTLRFSNTKPILSNELGITFVEVLAAMVILTIGILGMAPMMVISISANEFSDDVTTIASAAQDRLEEMIGRGSFATIPYVDCETFDNEKYEVVSVVLDHSVDPGIPDNVYEINVTMNWTDHSGIDRSLTFSTYTAKY